MNITLSIITTEMLLENFMPNFLKIIVPTLIVGTILLIIKTFFEVKIHKRNIEKDEKRQEEITKNAIKKALKEIEEEKARN